MNIMKCSLLHKNYFVVSKGNQTLKLVKCVWIQITVNGKYNFLLDNLSVAPDVNVKFTEDYLSILEQFKYRSLSTDLTWRFEFTRL
jgi:hypothetical protein